MALDVSGIAVFVGVLLWVVARAPAPSSGLVLASMALAAVAGVCAADLATGLVHWLGDTFGSEHTPIVGPALIAPFRAHHHDPQAIARHGFVEVTGNNAWAVSPLLLAVGCIAPWAGAEPWAAGLFGFGLALAVTGAFSNQLHRYAHMAQVPRTVHWLQRAGLLLSREAHARHHGARHDHAFCVVNGWMNPVLDRWLRS